MRAECFPESAIVLLSDGRILKVIESSSFDTKKKKGLICVRFMDRDEHSYVEGEKLDVVEVNTGLTALMIFESSRSIHVRLNRLSSV